jgi:rhodanese-related sulfurtransferase
MSSFSGRKTTGIWPRRTRRDLLAATVVVGLSAAVGLTFNALRSEGIPLVAREAYQVFVPCPETTREAGKASLADLAENQTVGFPAGAVLIDARSPAAFALGHIPEAFNLPYDELNGIADQDVAKLKQMGGAGQLIVYCDGWEEEKDPALRYAHPPSEHLADELKSLGLDNVVHLTGGLAEYVKRGGRLSPASGEARP